jgi:hypothetical protein
MDKPCNFYKNTYHHLYNLGTNKQLIFFEKANYTFFLEKLRNYSDKYIIENPLKASFAFKIKDWEFSNAKDLFVLRNDDIADLEEVVFYFKSETQMRVFLSDQNIKVNYEI